MVGVAQLVEYWIVAPVVAGSNPVAHPIFFAPVAQLDRVPDFESVGRRFESCRAHQIHHSNNILNILVAQRKKQS